MKEEALKLADEMDKHNESFNPWILHSSAMIRRLVEELDEKNYRILELTKRYKALTWNDKQGSSIWDSTRRVYENCQCDSCKNKTTPQTKPLSDEDIDAIGDEVSSLIDTYAGRLEFARAIEERHGIK